MGMPIPELDHENHENHEKSDSYDWRSTLSPNCRQRIEKKIMDSLQMNLSTEGQDCMAELSKISKRFEEKIYLSATNKEDYVQMIAVKLTVLERRAKSHANQ